MNTLITSADVRPAFVPAAPVLPSAVGAWHQSPVAVDIIGAINDLSTISKRIETVRIQNTALHALRDVEYFTGHVASRLVRKDYARGMEYRLMPSHGTCAVDTLWDVLRGLREAAIDAQLMMEGLPCYTDAGLTQEQSDAAYERYRELDGLAPLVEDAVLRTPMGEA